MFNGDQRGHMRSLAAMPLEAKCGCGWDRLGHCVRCRDVAARVRGVTHRRVTSWPDGDRDEYAPPGEPVTDWRGLDDWLRRVAPACFSEPLVPSGADYTGPWVRTPAARTCLRCQSGLLARRFPRDDDPDRLILWCRTCGTVGSAGLEWLEPGPTEEVPT